MAPPLYRFILHITALSALLSSVFCSSASATIVLPISLAQLTQRTDTIVTGVVTETRSYWNQGQIFTDVTIETMEYLKHPDTTRPDQLVITTLGGQVEDLRMDVDGVPQFAPDQEGVFFLKKKGETLTIFGLHYGLCRIYTDPATGTQKVGGTLYQARTNQDISTMALSLNPLPPQGELLSSLFQRIRTHLESQKESP